VYSSLWLTFRTCELHDTVGNATQPGEKDIEKANRLFSEWMASSNGQRKLQSDTPVRVSVYVHVITAANGSRGKVSESAIATQMEILDAAFQPYFAFDLVKTDYTNNDGWHNNALSFDTLTPRSEMKEALHQGGPASLNIYVAGTTNTDRGVLLGLATFPDEYETAYVLRFVHVDLADVVVGCCCQSAQITHHCEGHTIMHSPSLDGVVVWHGTLPDGSCGEICNQGYTVVHEGESITFMVLGLFLPPLIMLTIPIHCLDYVVGHWLGKCVLNVVRRSRVFVLNCSFLQDCTIHSIPFSSTTAASKGTKLTIRHNKRKPRSAVPSLHRIPVRPCRAGTPLRIVRALCVW
jgi:hypothetical protein